MALITASGVAGAAVTLTIPATSSVGHRIELIRVQLYNSAARTGSAAPVSVTSTNLSGMVLWFATVGAIGTSEIQELRPPVHLQGDAINAATTIVCPATPNGLWRVTVIYHHAG